MKANRSRNLFDRKSNKPFKISRSKFEAFLKCKKCFYIDRVMAVNFPSNPPYTLNNLVDELLKKEFDGYRKDQKPHPVFKTINFNGVPFQHENLDKWRTSLTGGVEYLDEKNNLILSGGIDDVWLDKSTNSIVVVDYKATAKTNGVADNILEQEFYDAYGRQMDFYFWLFKKNKFKVADYGYFMFCNGIKAKEDFNKQMDFEYKLIKYEHKTDWIDDKIKEMRECMLSEKVPAANENCEFCTYSTSVNKFYNA